VYFPFQRVVDLCGLIYFYYFLMYSVTNTPFHSDSSILCTHPLASSHTQSLIWITVGRVLFFNVFCGKYTISLRSQHPLYTPFSFFTHTQSLIWITVGRVLFFNVFCDKYTISLRSQHPLYTPFSFYTHTEPNMDNCGEGMTRMTNMSNIVLLLTFS
jgi:hypothetical protein